MRGIQEKFVANEIESDFEIYGQLFHNIHIRDFLKTSTMHGFQNSLYCNIHLLLPFSTNLLRYQGIFV